MLKSLQCKRCRDGFTHEESVALFKQHHYHFHCFLCIDCQTPLSHESFYLDDKLQLDVACPQVYCESCYLKRCAACSACHRGFLPSSIVVEFQGQDYHTECFVCTTCQSSLRDHVFYSKNEQLYCHPCLNAIEPCLQALRSPHTASQQCKKCGKHFLVGEAISVYQCDYYHANCFRCGDCQTFLTSRGFFRQEDGRLYCLHCHIENGPRCAKCNEPFLTGETLSQFDGKQFHQSCFLCDACEQVIETKTFQFRNGQARCENCSPVVSSNASGCSALSRRKSTNDDRYASEQR